MAVLDDNRAATLETDEELLTRTMGVFAANAGSRNIVYCEKAGGRERQLARKFSDQKVAADVIDSF